MEDDDEPDELFSLDAVMQGFDRRAVINEVFPSVIEYFDSLTRVGRDMGPLTSTRIYFGLVTDEDLIKLRLLINDSTSKYGLDLKQSELNGSYVGKNKLFTIAEKYESFKTKLLNDVGVLVSPYLGRITVSKSNDIDKSERYIPHSLLSSFLFFRHAVLDK